jgi:hypothetical protein
LRTTHPTREPSCPASTAARHAGPSSTVTPWSRSARSAFRTDAAFRASGAAARSTCLTGSSTASARGAARGRTAGRSSNTAATRRAGGRQLPAAACGAAARHTGSPGGRLTGAARSATARLATSRAADASSATARLATSRAADASGGGLAGNTAGTRSGACRTRYAAGLAAATGFARGSSAACLGAAAGLSAAACLGDGATRRAGHSGCARRAGRSGLIDLASIDICDDRAAGHGDQEPGTSQHRVPSHLLHCLFEIGSAEAERVEALGGVLPGTRPERKRGRRGAGIGRAFADPFARRDLAATLAA